MQESIRRVIEFDNLQVRGAVGLIFKKRKMLREKVGGGKGPFLGLGVHRYTGNILDAIHGQNGQIQMEIE